MGLKEVRGEALVADKGKRSDGGQGWVFKLADTEEIGDHL